MLLAISENGQPWQGLGQRLASAADVWGAAGTQRSDSACRRAA